MRLTLLAICLVPLVPFAGPSTASADDPTKDDVLRAMKKAAEFYRTKVAVQGGYVYYTSLDLKTRHGEGPASPTQIWVQPPGTPSVGEAYLAAHEATGDSWYLEAAAETAMALVEGQLKSGGWTHSIEFDTSSPNAPAYRNGKGGRRNNSTLDDNTTQSALSFLMKVDKAHRFQHERVHDAARFALDSLLNAQFANGGFPQVWTAPAEVRPVMKASFPEYDWRTENRIKEYWNMYTLNDGLAGDVMDTLLLAEKIYDDPRALNAVKKLGDFLILAQMPEPQPAWAQQYDKQMHPCWARKFEPPAITGGESRDVMETLIAIAERTGDDKYLAPIPSALAYFKKSLLPGNRLARYYELRTNKPLYMNSKYELTHDGSDAPKHYSWSTTSWIETVEKRFHAAKLKSAKPRTSGKSRPNSARVKDVLQSLDSEGRWLLNVDGTPLAGQPKFRPGDRVLSSQLFSQNLKTLSQFVETDR